MNQTEARKIAGQVGGVAVTEARFLGRWGSQTDPWGIAVGGIWYGSLEELEGGSR